MLEGIEIPVSVPGGEAGERALLAIAEALEALRKPIAEIRDETTQTAGAWGRFAQSIVSTGSNIVGTVERIGLGYRNIVGPIEDVVGKVDQLATATIRYAREQQTIDNAQRQTGLSFRDAARAGTAYVSTLTASTAAMRLNTANIRLNQEQMNALTRVATNFAVATGQDTTHAVEMLTDALINGEAEGLRRFGGSLASAAGESSTVNDRLRELVRSSQMLGTAQRDVGQRIDEARGAFEELKREFASGFVEGVTTALNAEDQVVQRITENVDRQHLSWNEWGIAAGRGLEATHQLLGGVLDLVMLIPAALASLDRVSLDPLSDQFDQLYASVLRVFAAARGETVTEAAPMGPIPTGGTPTADLITGAVQSATDQARTLVSALTELSGPNAEQAASRITGRNVSALMDAIRSKETIAKQMRESHGGGGGDPFAQIRQAMTLSRDLAQQERGDVERSIALRQRESEMQRVLNGDKRDALTIAREQRDLASAAANEQLEADEQELSRTRSIIELAERRLERTHGRRRVELQRIVNELQEQEVTITRRMEDASASAARAEAELANALDRRAEATKAAQYAATDAEESERARSLNRRRERLGSAVDTASAAIGEGGPRGSAEMINLLRTRVSSLREITAENDNALATARERHVTEEEYDALLRTRIDLLNDSRAAQEQLTDAEIQSSNFGTRGAAMMRRDRDNIVRFFRDQANAALDLSRVVEDVYGRMTDAVATHFNAWVTGQETFAEATQAMVHDTLSALAEIASKKAVMELAEGISALFFNPAAAAGHFAAAALFGVVAGGAGVAAQATAPATADKGAAERSAASSRERAANVSPRNDSSGGGAVVYNVNFGGPMYGTGGVRQAARQMVGAINRGAIQGGVQLLPGALQAAGAGT